MRVLVLTDFYPPTIGGVEGHVATLSEHLVRRGYNVAVCTVRQKGVKPFEVYGGVRVHRLRQFFRGREVCSQPFTPACCAEQYGLTKSVIASTYVKRKAMMPSSTLPTALNKNL